MKSPDWKRLKHFNPDENWGNWEAIDFRLLFFLDCYRAFVGQQIVVVCGTQGVHKSEWHKKGLAVDCVLDGKHQGQLNSIFAAMRFPFTGLGVYPRARHPKFRRPIGFHFDIREINDMPQGVCRAQWIGIPDSNGEVQYYGLTEGALKRWEVI